ncbi:golgin candidate 5-like [Dorcoceras hygrometricum]|uniref:Golgin candidate 5-like n=1 Tax=Dorcoceras hygrometricum TaxID=472368 RepID=A0A2Z7C5I3_9LAMI|nr:golgin candidate 5-like [Dorcoceras hygrometricum]
MLYGHRFSLEELRKQMREHKLEWIRPYSSRLFERSQYRLCVPSPDTVAAEPVVNIETDPTESLGTSQRHPYADSDSSSSSRDSPMHFTADDLPLDEETNVAYINRGRDDKKGEVSSIRGPQPPDDRIRPGSGDSERGRGSISEPSRKRGSGYRGGGSTSSRRFRYWLGGS